VRSGPPRCGVCMLISILCPSRGRPLLAKKMMESARKTARKQPEILFYVDDDDPTKDEYLSLGLPVVLGPNVPTPVAYELLAGQANGDMFLIMGDDCVFQTQDWDVHMKEAVKPEWKRDNAYIVSVYDGRELNSHGHFAIGRGWRDALGYILPPVFRHWATNMFTTDIAERIGRLAYLPDVVLMHNKIHEQEIKDETHDRIRLGGVRLWDQLVMDTCYKFADLDESILRRWIEAKSREGIQWNSIKE